jgi:hypothetical protein
MRWRRPAIRSVLIVGALTTLATSAAEGDRVEARKSIAYFGEGQDFVVWLSEETNENAVFLEMRMGWPNFATDGASVLITPESEALEPLIIEAFASDDAGAPSPPADADAGDASVPRVGYDYDLGLACPDEGPCELRFHLQPYGAASRVRGDLVVSVIAQGPTEPGLCSDQPEFGSGATIVIDEEP